MGHVYLKETQVMSLNLKCYSIFSSHCIVFIYVIPRYLMANHMLN